MEELCTLYQQAAELATRGSRCHLRLRVLAAQEAMRLNHTYIATEHLQKMRITEGPFKGFAGTITAATPGRRQVRVEIALAGRRNDIDLDILHVTPW